MEQTKPWKVGDLAQLTGLTVRTLHHWNELGSISPPRTESGHRCHSGTDVTRLYQAMALKQIGLGPDQIAVLFTSEAPAPRTTLQRPPQRRRSRPTAPAGIARPVGAILDALGHEDADIDVQLLLKLIQKMTMFENQLTTEQREWFTRRREQIGEDRWQAALNK